MPLKLEDLHLCKKVVLPFSGLCPGLCPGSILKEALWSVAASAATAHANRVHPLSDDRIWIYDGWYGLQLGATAALPVLLLCHKILEFASAVNAFQLSLFDEGRLFDALELSLSVHNHHRLGAGY